MALRLWTGLLAARLFLVLPSLMCNGLKAPALNGCVFVHRANITCKWKPGDSQTTHYTLNVQNNLDPSAVGVVSLVTLNSSRLPLGHSGINSFFSRRGSWSCTTPNTSCTVWIENLSVHSNFCINITAHSRHGDVSSESRCQLGLKEVMLPPVNLENITPVDGKPQCLTLSWREKKHFPISERLIEEGRLESQIEVKADGLPGVRVSDVTEKSNIFVACVFRPDTLYSVRLRHRYQGGTSPWSYWSNDFPGKTAEDAPSSAPMFWRQEINKDSYRLTSLLWKPLPHDLANGRILSYNISCEDENAEGLQEKGNCTHLDISHTSCVLKLPLGPCSCSISASTSVGTSPKASIWLSKAYEKDLPPPWLLSVTAVDDRSLELKWARSSAAPASLSGFIVEWFVVTQEKNNRILHWERVNSSTTAVIITEGVEPFQRYAVSVRALYGKEGGGQSQTELVYTRQGVPSAGPQVSVETSGSTVKLNWSLPVEQRRGFIRSYTLFYQTTNQTVKSEPLHGTFERHSVDSLSPGIYEFWMQASTDAGAGAIGPHISANIGPEENNVVVFCLLPIALISLLLIVMVCVAQNKIVKGALCQEVPDPSHSSVSKWSPKTVTGMNFSKPDIKYSDVVLLSARETENYEWNQDKDLQTCSYPSSPTYYNPFNCETKYQTGARTTNMADTNFNSCPVIYSNILFSNADSASLLELQHHSYPDVRHNKQPQEGVSEQSLFSTDIPFYKMQQPDFARLHNVNLNIFTSKPLEYFSEIEPTQKNTSFSGLPFPDSLFMDFMDLSQSSMQCDPYLPV